MEVEMRIRTTVAATLLLACMACADENGQVKIEEDSPGLAAKARVAGEKAESTALAKVPGAEISEASIEEEQGRLVYSFDLKVKGQPGVQEVLVDAMTGVVVSQEHESEAQEAAEAKGEEGGEAKEPGEADVDGKVHLSVEKPGLAARAKVSDEAARAAALVRVPGGRIVEAELEEEDGLLIYSYDVKVAGREGVEEVHVDAATGRVVKTEHEGGEGGL
jgi:uncharacterized membrane protein YkoI